MSNEISLNYNKLVPFELNHFGVHYLDFLGIIAKSLAAKTYFEIGTSTGSSLKQVSCDAVCVDPNFQVSQDILSGRHRAHFFQSTSDDFFAHYDLRTYFPGGFDLAFLDGLHLFEALLRDFINTERATHAGSVVLLHDCLPTNQRMAERENRILESENIETRYSWTGDVWKLLPIFQKYRPELHVVEFDCGPTGLIACTGMNRYSNVLPDNFNKIIDEFAAISIADFGLRRVWEQFPMRDTWKLAENPADVAKVLFSV